LNWVDFDETVSKRKIGLENNQPALPNMDSGGKGVAAATHLETFHAVNKLFQYQYHSK